MAKAARISVILLLRLTRRLVPAGAVARFIAGRHLAAELTLEAFEGTPGFLFGHALLLAFPRIGLPARATLRFLHALREEVLVVIAFAFGVLREFIRRDALGQFADDLPEFFLLLPLVGDGFFEREGLSLQGAQEFFDSLRILQ
jgi:hypothetical protein